MPTIPKFELSSCPTLDSPAPTIPGQEIERSEGQANEQVTADLIE